MRLCNARALEIDENCQFGSVSLQAAVVRRYYAMFARQLEMKIVRRQSLLIEEKNALRIEIVSSFVRMESTI